MMSFIFWSSPKAGADAAAFERLLLEFHGQLAETKLAGFRKSETFRTQAAEWCDWPGAVYEDWYVGRNFATLDSLSEWVQALDAGDPASSHRQLMRQTAEGTAGVYTLRFGRPRLDEQNHAHWFDADSIEGVLHAVAEKEAESTGLSASLWVRALGLGPRKFCLQSNSAVDDLPFGEIVIRHRDRLTGTAYQ